MEVDILDIIYKYKYFCISHINLEVCIHSRENIDHVPRKPQIKNETVALWS